MKNQNLADVSVGYTNNICKVEKIGNQFQMITAEGINIGNGGANTGSGGGGAGQGADYSWTGRGGTGGSGIIVIRYAI